MDGLMMQLMSSLYNGYNESDRVDIWRTAILFVISLHSAVCTVGRRPKKVTVLAEQSAPLMGGGVDTHI